MANKRPKTNMVPCPNPKCDYVGHSLQKHYDMKHICRDFVASAQRLPCPNPMCDYLGPQLQQHYLHKQTCGDFVDHMDHRLAPGADTIIHREPVLPWSDSDDDDATAVVPAAVVAAAVRLKTPIAVLRRRARHVATGFTTDQYIELKLLKLLNDNKTPHGLYTQVLEWAADARTRGYNFAPIRKKRSAHINYLTRWQSLQAIQPYQVPVPLPGTPPLTINVTVFDFEEQLMSLFADRQLFGNVDNLDVNRDDPFGKYKPVGGFIDCVNAGEFYQSAYDNLCTNMDDLLAMTIFTWDETTKATGAGSTLAPLRFTSALLNQAARNKEAAWRTLAFLPDLSAFESSTDRKLQGPEGKSRRFHAMMAAGLKSYISAMHNPEALTGIEMTLGTVTKVVRRLHPCCVLLIGDLQGGDKNAGSAASYLSSMARLCRQCNVPGAQAANLYYRCKRISMLRVMRMVAAGDRSKLDKFNQYCVHSAWFDVCYGGDKYGIFSAAMPVEALHALENGVFLYCCQVLLSERLTKACRARLDEEARTWCKWPRQRLLSSGAEPNMPRLLWKDGVTSTVGLQAKYKTGLLLTYVCMSLRRSGRAIFADGLAVEAPPKVKGARWQPVYKMRKLFQRLLAYRLWLDKKKYWRQGDTEAANRVDAKIRLLFTDLQTHWPRLKGQAWCLAKVHEQTHVWQHIIRHGPPSGTLTITTEHQHVVVKKEAVRTQGLRQKLDEQTANRVADTMIIDTCWERMESSQREAPVVSTEAPVTAFVPQATLGCLTIYTCPEAGVLKHTLKVKNASLVVAPVVLTLLKADMTATGCNHRVYTVLTEVVIGNELYRAHPAYRTQQQGWFDWVMLRYEKDDTVPRPHPGCQAWYPDGKAVMAEHSYAPGRIHTFLTTAPPNAKGQYDIDTVTAVVATCDFAHSPTRHSLFTTEWKAASVFANGRRQNRLEVVDATAIVRHALMIPEDETAQTFQEVWPKALWAAVFSED